MRYLVYSQTLLQQHKSLKTWKPIVSVGFHLFLSSPPPGPRVLLWLEWLLPGLGPPLPSTSLSLSSWGLPFCLSCSVSWVRWFCLSRLTSRLVGVDLLQQLPDEGCLCLQSDKVFLLSGVIWAEGGIPGWTALRLGLEGPSLIQEPVGGHSDFPSSAISLWHLLESGLPLFFSLSSGIRKTCSSLGPVFLPLFSVLWSSVFRWWASCTHLLIFSPFTFHVFVFGDISSWRILSLPIFVNLYLSHF